MNAIPEDCMNEKMLIALARAVTNCSAYPLRNRRSTVEFETPAAGLSDKD
jgi:hypothetical protein